MCCAASSCVGGVFRSGRWVSVFGVWCVVWYWLACFLVILLCCGSLLFNAIVVLCYSVFVVGFSSCVETPLRYDHSFSYFVWVCVCVCCSLAFVLQQHPYFVADE